MGRGGQGILKDLVAPNSEVGSYSLDLFFHPALHDRHPGLGRPLPWERLEDPGQPFHVGPWVPPT